MYKKTIFCSIILAFIVIILGAYTRLSDAGLGCPDWPGCYGKLIVPDVADGSQIAGYDRPVEVKKGWIEMIHRYMAAILGLLIISIVLMTFSNHSEKSRPKTLSAILLLLVIFQGILGMFTVTKLVHPLIVSMHLLWGFAIMSLLFWLWLSQTNKANIYKQHILKRHKVLIIAVFILLLIQIFLGSWTSTNYAALSCGNDFPTCLNQLWPQNMDFKSAFFLGKLGVNYEGGILSNDARIAIQMLHRIGAIILSIAVIFLIYNLKLYKILKKNLKIIAILLIFQIILGISNIIFGLPILIASMHNGFALLLLLGFLPIIYKVFYPTK